MRENGKDVFKSRKLLRREELKSLSLSPLSVTVVSAYSDYSPTLTGFVVSVNSNEQRKFGSRGAHSTLSASCRQSNSRRFSTAVTASLRLPFCGSVPDGMYSLHIYSEEMLL
ncbi:hypothetical protein Nepgr_009228 [Nepenthes gracilis]|uniref:Uncharacterized protein n=1 Tax=Nepenthes gracilis TaxID=150966 RepID=A0AAD3SA84_NEPGR|nr:hypothetical protein Nepgr_009228 [Nepenthes gracilis]